MDPRRSTLQLQPKIELVPWSPRNRADYHHLPLDGCGKGEFKLTREKGAPWYGGSVQGNEKNFDILLGKKKWEVKSLDSTDEIQVKSEGLKNVLKFVLDVVTSLDELHSVSVVASEDRRLIRAIKERLYRMQIPRGIVLGQTPMNPVGVLQLLQKYEDIVTSDDKYVGDPTRIIPDWTNLVSLSEVMSHVDGLIVVNEKGGYRNIEIDDADDYFEFSRVSRQSVNFRLRRPLEES